MTFIVIHYGSTRLFVCLIPPPCRFLGHSLVFDLSKHGPSDRCDLLPLLFAFQWDQWEWLQRATTDLLALQSLRISGALSPTCAAAAGHWDHRHFLLMSWTPDEVDILNRSTRLFPNDLLNPVGLFSGRNQDTFSFYALLLWILALLLLSWQLLLSLQRGLRRSPEVLFFPDPSGAHVRHLCHLLRGSRKRMWIAMFTLTDDVLTQEILNAWERKVDVKDRADVFFFFFRGEGGRGGDF